MNFNVPAAAASVPVKLLLMVSIVYRLLPT
jgi:hypothetical protein